jgi:hypothetical protein
VSYTPRPDDWYEAVIARAEAELQEDGSNSGSSAAMQEDGSNSGSSAALQEGHSSGGASADRRLVTPDSPNIKAFWILQEMQNKQVSDCIVGSSGEMMKTQHVVGIRGRR